MEEERTLEEERNSLEEEMKLCCEEQEDLQVTEAVLVTEQFPTRQTSGPRET